MRTRERLAVAKARGRKDKQPELSKTQRKLLLRLHGADELLRFKRGTEGRPVKGSISWTTYSHPMAPQECEPHG